MNKISYYFTYLFLNLGLCTFNGRIFNWKYKYNYLNHRVIRNNLHVLDTSLLIKDYFVPESILKEMFTRNLVTSKLDLFFLIKNQTLSNSLLREFKDNLSWSWISCYQTLSEDTIREFKECVDWTLISCKQRLSTDFILEFNDYIDWFTIMKNPYLHLDFVSQCQQYLDWNSVSLYMTPNIQMFQKYEEKLNWDLISSERVLSEEFIIKLEDNINFNLLLKNKNQQAVYKYYSLDIIDILNPYFNNYRVYHEKATKIACWWKDKLNSLK